jgi:hypothetical protein
VCPERKLIGGERIEERIGDWREGKIEEWDGDE